MDTRSRLVGLLVLTLVVLPLLSVPLLLIGAELRPSIPAGAVDRSTPLLLGVGGPSVLAMIFAYRKVKSWLPAALLGVATGMMSVVVLFAAFVIYCYMRAPCIV
jgi:hypothetical protein